MYKTVSIITIFISVLCFQQVFADNTCAAQANFDGCKVIQSKVLSNCGLVDYSCQCNAQRLILQCYDLCPNYTSEASIQNSQVLGICAAVPPSLAPSVPVLSSTMNKIAAATSSVSNSNINMPHASETSLSSPSSPSPSSSTNSNYSAAANIYPTAILVIACAFAGLF